MGDTANARARVGAAGREMASRGRSMDALRHLVEQMESTGSGSENQLRQMFRLPQPQAGPGAPAPRLERIVQCVACAKVFVGVPAGGAALVPMHPACAGSGKTANKAFEYINYG